MTEPADQVNRGDCADPPAPLGLLCVMVPTVLWAAWWLMMASHESGHVIATLVTGGGIDRIDLSPLGFSQTHSSPNPRPMTVVWAGPIVGVLDPLVAWLWVVWLRRRDPQQWLSVEPVFTFLAGFCLLANGAYLGLGWIDRIGDTGEMIRLGTPVWLMISFGIVNAACGLTLWHRLGPWLGLKHITLPQAKHLLTASLIVLALAFGISLVL